MIASIAQYVTLFKSDYDDVPSSFSEALIVQEKIKRKILQSLYPKEWVITSDFSDLPLHNYNDLKDTLIQGKWFTGKSIEGIQAFATSSGSSSGGDPLSVKYFPVMQATLDGSYKSMMYMLASYIRQTGRNPYDSKFLSIVRPVDETSRLHDKPLWYISGILDRYGSSAAKLFAVFPSSFLKQLDHQVQHGIISSDDKVHEMCRYLHDEYQGIVGVISWVPHRWLWLMEVYRTIYGNDAFHQKFDIQLWIYGGWPTAVHRASTRLLFPSAYFANAYNAGEWFYAIQDRHFADIDYHAMCLMTDNDIYYEFVAQEDYNTYYKHAAQPNLSDLHDKIIDLSQVENNRHYVLFISTTWWLVRYNVGDVVAFVDKEHLQIEVKWRVNGWCNHLNEHIEAPHIDSFIADHPDYGIVWYYCITQQCLDGAFKYLFCPIVKDDVDVPTLTQSFDDSLQSQNPNYKKVRESKYLLTPDVRLIHEKQLIEYLSARGQFISGQTKIPHMVYEGLYDDTHQLCRMLRELGVM